MRTWILLLSSIAVASNAFANGIDTTFGTNGRVVLDTPASAWAQSAILQTDGKIVVVGTTPSIDRTSTVELIDPLRDIIVVRFNANGSLDSSFGTGGKVYIDVNHTDDRGASIAQQSDGKLLVLGDSLSERGDFDFALARLRTDGSLDTTFNGSGIKAINTPLTVTTNVGGGIVTTVPYSNNQGRKLVMLPDGKALVLGVTSCPPGGPYGCAPAGLSRALTTYLTLLRVLPSGSVDTNFGPDGTGIVAGVNGSFFELLPRPDGSILIFGDRAIRLRATDASPEYLQYPIFSGLSFFAAYSAVPQGNDHILVSGLWIPTPTSTSPYPYAAAVGRLDANLIRDPSFGNDSIANAIFGPAFSTSNTVLAEPSGKILAAGLVSRTTTVDGHRDGAIARMLANGGADVNFGNNGLLKLEFNDGSTPHSFWSGPLLRTADGKLILVGTRSDLAAMPTTATAAPGSERIALVRVTSTPQFAITQSSASVTEGQPSIAIDVTRTGTTNEAVSVSYSASAGTANTTTDFANTVGTLTWQPNDLDKKTIVVPITNDNAVESSEQFTVSISAPSEGSLEQSTATITITDDDTSQSSGGSNGGNGGGGTIEWLTCLLLTMLASARARWRIGHPLNLDV